MKPLKYSRQREAIKAFLCSRCDHPSADMVFDNVRKEFPNISLGTVYRNLNLLVDIGEAIKITTKDGSDRFDARTNPHYHFICNNCGAVEDLLMPPVLDVQEQASNCINAEIESHEIKFWGLCNKCKHHTN